MRLLLIITLFVLSGCASLHSPPNTDIPLPVLVESTSYTSEAPTKGKVFVAVYGYADLTGQRASAVQSLSTAVTQGAENYLINALRDYSDGDWFRVVERKSVDNIIRERQIVRSSRNQVDARIKELPPMLYAGIIVEGGIIGYDSNVKSGGQGAMVFGLGMSEKYNTHIVTVAMRVVSVTTSEVLLSVIVEKNIISYSDNITGIKFFDLDRQVLELENGMNVHEAPNYAVRKAIEYSVHKTVQQGLQRNIW